MLLMHFTRMKKNTAKPGRAIRQSGNTELFQSVTTLIEQSKQKVFVTVNSELVTLYWNIGRSIRQKILHNKRAEYGRQIISLLSTQLIRKYGKGSSEKHLNQCLRSAETFSQKQIVYALRIQLSWTHLRSVLHFEDKFKKGNSILWNCLNSVETFPEWKIFFGWWIWRGKDISTLAKYIIQTHRKTDFAPAGTFAPFLISLLPICRA